MNSKFKRVATTSERLKEAMSLRKMKQVDIMRSTGIDRGSVSHYVSGTYEPKNEAVFKIAKALDVNEMWLWGYDVPMERTAEQKRIQEDAEFHARILKDQELLDALKVYYKLPEVQQKIVIDLIYSLEK